MDKNIELLKRKDEELSEALEKMENQSENNDIDDVIVPTAPLYKQILNLYAEENAIEDTIFYLGEALHRGVIDLEVFLKVKELTQLHRNPEKKQASCLYTLFCLVTARTPAVQEAVPASCPHAESPQDCRPQ